MKARLQLTSVTLGAAAPRALADFYAALLSAQVCDSEPPRPGEPDEAGWAQVRTGGDDGGGVTLNFEYERCYERPVWPSEPGRPQTMEHLDIYVDDLECATAWALECGAVPAAHQPQPDVRVLLDPAGHPFCLFT